MCKDNTITTSWSWAGAVAAAFFVIGGFLATSLGIRLTWGEIILIPFILTFFSEQEMLLLYGFWL